MELLELDIPKAKISQLNSKKIETVEELVEYVPRKYYDFTKPKYIKELLNGEYAAVIGLIYDVDINPKRIVVSIKDQIGWKMKVTFWGQQFLAGRFKVGMTYLFGGKISKDRYSTNINAPLYYTTNYNEAVVMPVYSKVKGMSNDYLEQTIDKAIALVGRNDYLEYNLVKKYSLVSNFEKISKIHNPKSFNDVDSAIKRKEFDELFKFNMQLYEKTKYSKSESPYKMPKMTLCKKLMEELPFELTEGQRLALRKMAYKMKNGERLNALVQADVGAGKTIVGIFLMLIAFENGFQSAMMAPTTVLAEQHYQELKEKIEHLGVNIAYLNGKTKKREKTKILKGLKDGSIHIVVGTHAIISKDVEFNSLGVVVVDEEHRFGAKQRELLVEKAESGVHSASMSATPIPRTLAMSMFGDNIDVITIKSLPTGRKPIITKSSNDYNKTLLEMESELNKGRQAYIICPFIEDNEDIEGVSSVESIFEQVSNHFKGKFNVGIISGDMKKEQVSEVILKFKNKEYDIIVSTTIVEVGVNVPNSTIILIKNAERFGLAQLHQLRGRVGRGSYQSYCILESEQKTDLAKEKIRVMCDTTDGFKIAEKDLELRGTGNFVGENQSGYNKYVELMIANPQLNESIKNDVKEIYSNRGRLNHYKFLNKDELV